MTQAKLTERQLAVLHFIARNGSAGAHQLGRHFDPDGTWQGPVITAASLVRRGLLTKYKQDYVIRYGVTQAGREHLRAEASLKKQETKR